MRAGIAAAKEGRAEEARELLYQAIDLDERSEKAWLWLSEVVTGLDERIICLEKVLAINPNHEVVREALNHLLAKRKEAGPGQAAARKVKMAREAIGHIKTSQSRAAAWREGPPVQLTPAMEKVVPEPLAAEPPPKPVAPVKEPVEPEREEGISIRAIPMACLYVLLAVLILILVLAALTYAGIL
jgi:tetratricopeptide (TPR) repeat protein